MSSGGPSLVLTPFGHEEKVLLVRPASAVALCRDGSHEAVPRRQLPTYWAQTCRLGPMEVRTFLSKVDASSRLSDLDNDELFQYLHALIQGDALVMVRECEDAREATTPADVGQRRLLDTLERQRLSSFNHAGRRYTLVAGDALGKMSGRDDFEVVRREDGIKLLEGLAERSGTAAAKLLAEVGQKLTRDWRPPFRPDGLVLLRAIIKPQAAAPAPTVPPPQQKAGPGPREDEEELDLDQECQASTLANAAQSGVPFCQECAG